MITSDGRSARENHRLAIGLLLGLMIVGAAEVSPAGAAVTNDVVVGVSGGNLFTLQVIRLNGTTGAPVWTYTSPMHNIAIGAVGLDPVDQSAYFAVGPYGQKLNSSGGLVWGGLVNGFPAVNWGNIAHLKSFAFDPLNRNVYASGACSHGWLGKINASNGSLAWSIGSTVSLALDDIPSLSVGYNDGSLYGVAGNNKELYKYSGAGSLIYKKTNFNWSVLTNDCGGGRGDFSRFNSNFYAAGGNTTGVFPTNYLYRLDQNGNIIDSYPLPLTARVTGVVVDNAIGSPYYGYVYVSAGNAIYKFNSSLSLIWGPVNIGNTADFLAVEPLGGGLFVGSIGGKFVQQRYTYDGSAGWTYSTGAQPPSAMSTQRLVGPYLTLTGSPQTLAPGSCSAVTSVKTFNAQNGLVTAGAVATLAASNGTLQFFTAAGCGGSPVTSITIPPGSSSANFYFKDTAAGTPAITASAAGYAYATQSETISLPNLAFTTPALTATAGSCSSAFATVQSRSPSNTPLNVGVNTPVNLASSDGTMTFFTAAGCAGSGVTSITILAGANSASFYVKDTAAGSPTVTASASGYTPTTQIETINPDTTPPDPVLDLAASAISATQVRLTWTSKGDNGPIGSIASGQYDIRWAPVASDPFNFNTATSILLPATGDPGRPLSATIGGLPPGTPVRFGLKTTDTAGNVSAISNTPFAQTFTVSPSLDGVVSMSAPIPVSIVRAGQNNAAAVLELSLDGGNSPASFVYEMTPSPYTFSSPARVTFKFDPLVVADLSTLFIYKAPTSAGPLSKDGITNQTIDSIANTISGDVAGLSFFVLLFKTPDTLAPRTALHIGTPAFSGAQTFVSSAALLSFSAVDDGTVVGDGAGVGVAQTQFAVDAGAFSVYTASFSLTAEGNRALRYFSTDKAGHVEAERAASVVVDSTPPQLALTPAAGSTLTVAASPIAAAYADSGSGADASSLRLFLDGVDVTAQSSIAAASAAFAASGLVEGSHLVRAEIADRVGNRARVSAAFTVDSVAPVTTLLLNGAAAGLGPLVIVSTDTLGFAASDSGAGVRETRFSVDGSSEAVYVSAFSLAAGPHSLVYRSIDRAGNVEDARSGVLNVLLYDVAAPSVTITPADQSTATTASPRIVAAYGDAGRGVDASSVRMLVDGVDVTAQTAVTASSAVYAPIYLGEGRHAASVSVYDLAGNGAAASTSFVVDSLPPVTALLVNGAPFSGSIVISTDALSFVAADAGTGVAGTLFAVDGSIETVFANPFSLATGAHSLVFHSTDRAGNLEAVKTATFTAVAPDTSAPSLALTPPDGSTVTAPRPLVIASYSDAGSGVDPASFRLALDGVDVTAYAAVSASSASYAPAAALAQGAHVVTAIVADNAGNASSLTSEFFLDSVAPRTVFRSPSTGDVFIPTVNSIVVDFLVDDDADPAPAVEAFLAELEDRGSPRGAAPSRVAVSTGSVISPLDIDDGLWRLEVTATDSAGNSSSAFSGSFEVIHDVRPPMTALTVDSPKAEVGGLTTITRATLLNLSSIDDLASAGDGGGLGVMVQSLSVDGVLRSTFTNTSPAAGQVFSSSFTLTADSDGRHLLAYRAQDARGNDETVHVTTIAVDNTAPQTSLTSLGGQEYLSPAALNRYVSSDTRFGLLAIDPLIGGVAAGVADTRLKDNGAVVYSGTDTFTLSEGLHALAFESEDRVGNIETAKSTAVAVDATAPRTTLMLMGGRQYPGADAASFYASSDTRLAFAASDPLVGGAASGVAFTRWQDNGGVFKDSVSNLLLAEGAHALAYQSRDNVANLEILRSTTVLVDATPPVSAVTLGAPSFTAHGIVHAAPATSVSFAGSDPALPTGEPGSGVARVEVSIDGGAYVPVAGPLTFGEGRHDVLYRALDNVGNVEAARALAIQSDATPPATALSISTPVSGGYVSSATRFVLAAVDPIVDGAASGVKLARYRVNGGDFATGPLDFGLSGADGAYTLEYQSEDNIGNLEVLRSTAVFLDRTPPITAVQVGAPSFTAVDGTLYVDPATPVTITAADSASGVERIEVSVDGASYTPYAAALTFAEGRHAILYRALDRVGNAETARTLNLRSDATPPLTAFAPSGSLYMGAGGASFAPLAFSYALPAADPVAGDVASGLALTRYALDSGAFQAYAATFTLTEGVRRVDFRSQDNVGNSELLKAATVFVDATPPVTALSVGAPQFAAGGTLYVSAGTSFSLASEDPAVLGVVSGLSSISFRVGADAFSSYASTFTLQGPDGARGIDWRAADNVGNLESVKSAAVYLDATAPRTSLTVVDGRQYPGADGASFYASSDTRLAFAASDPLVGGAASGVAFTRWHDNGGVFQAFASNLLLAEGAHALAYQSRDNVANLEILRSTTVLVDTTPPVSAVTLGAPSFTALGIVHVAPATPVSFAGSDPALPTGEPGSGVARVEVSIDGGAYVSVTGPLTFGEGRHDVLYRALDNVGNVETVRALAIQSDATPPATTLSISTPLSGGYVSSATRFVLAAVDPIVNGAASGVKLSRYRVNGGSFVAGPLDFGLSGADGAYSLEYQSEDKIGNLEVLRSTGVFLDQTPPVTAVQVGAPSFTAADGTLYVDPAAPVSLAAADAASGVERIEVSLDGAPYAAYVQALTFSEGRHTVLYRAVDKVGNVETARTLSLRSDATPPLTTFVPSGTLFAGAGGALFSPAGFTYAFSALDPIAGDVASGVAFTRFRTDSASSGLFGSYASTFSLTEGVRRVEFQSQDNLGHLELLRSATVFVDATAPLTALDIGLPRFDSNGTLYVSTGTPLSLASQDPVVLDVASGLSSIAFQIGVGAFSPYVSTFTLQVPDGSRAISWHAADNVGNQEGAKTSTVFLDATAPHTSLQLVGGRRYPAADAGSFYASSDTRLALVASDPPVNGSASGVALTRWQDDGGAFQAYSAALTLAEGAHALRYQSQDNVSNLEVLRSTTALVDATPPVTSVSAGAPSFTAADGTFHVAPATPVSFVAADPALPSGQTGSGVERVEVSVDGGAFAAASGPLTFGEGRHEVLYRALDNVGNVEAVRALSIQSDATPPVATLSISTPVTGGYVSGATRFILSAVDPVVGGAASGVKLARYRVNGGAFVTAPLDFGLSGADGAYTVEYLSEDNIGNLEISRSTSVFLDQTPPVTSVTVGASSDTAVDGTLYVDPASPVAMTAEDAASGVERIEVSVDGAPFTAYAVALTFAEGRHEVSYRAVDKVGNAETARTLSLRSDATPPLTTFAPSGALFAGSGGELFAPPSFSYALPAADPVVNGVASGLAFTRYSLDSAAFQPHAGTFTLTEGVRRVDFQSADNVGHFELLRGATVFVDATAPLTALGIGAPQYPSSGTVYVSTATPFSLVSQDPVIAGVASGVSVISFRLDAAAIGSYLSDFRIPGPDGPRSVSWFAADNVGNVETVKNANVELDATAPRSSLLVIGGRQVPGPDASVFYASSDTRIAFIGEDPVVGGAASGLAWIRFQDNGGGFQGFAVPLALGEGRHALGYQGQDNVFNLEVLRSTTVLVDATPPVTAVSIGAPNFTDADGTIYVAPASSISFSASDPSLPSGEAGSGVERVEVSVDGSVYTAFAAPLTFSEGLHAVRYRALDLVGNVEVERTLRLRSDATPPASGLAIGEPSFSLSSAAVLVSAATPLSVSVLDPEVNAVASGVKETFYRIVDVAPSTASFLVFTASFTLTGVDRAVSVEFFSRDRVLNTESVSSRALLLDSTRPDAVIDSPHGGNGVCSVVKGMIPVRGTARDLHFASYSLESAAGQDASAGFVLVSSGTAEVDAGLLGNWDARASAGWRTLRLTVIDQVRNASVLTLSVYVGDPGRLMVLGNHETFNMPQGVAAGVDGRIYIADTNDDRVQVFSATGTALVSLGRGHGREEDEGLRLNKPRGVAVDAEGAIFVADTNNDRVLKLSATGQILLEVGRRKPGRKDDDKDGKGKNESQEFQPGKGPGEFRKPSGIAVDAAGNIFVSDTDNNRVQKLGPDGTPLLAFSLPPALGDGEEQDHDCEDPELGRPVGIALDAAGNIYVADPRGARALKFDPAGRLLMTLPIESAASKPGRPEGVAVSPDGGCLLVSDPSSSRVIKFDAAGARTLAFGERGKILDNKPLSRQLVMRKPAGLALDAGGKLYVADRNNDRIQVFGLPTGEPASVVPPPVYDHDDEHVARDVVDREEGGQVERDDRAGVSIPAGALAEDLRITVSTPAVAGEGDRDRNREDQNLKVVSAPVEYGPEGTKFKEAVTLVLPYTPGLIAAQGLAEDSLKINYWNKEKGEWEALESEVDKKNGTVKAKTPHFSLYQVLGSTGASAAIAPLAADASFGLKDMYAFPNPVRGQGPVTIRVQPGLADSVTVRVYDMSGRKVHESSNFSDRGAFDDGNGKGQQFTYDHVWDVSGVGSGVYTFVVTATKSGERDIHKTGKVGIVK